MNLAESAWTAVRDALASGAPVAALLPCGATEAHGPHLPLNTDVVISEAFALHAAQLLEERGIKAIILPSLAYAPAEYAAEFPGTIGISADTAKALILDIARALKAQGFGCLAIANSHFDPANVAMLRSVSEDVQALGFAVAFPDFTRRALAQSLTEEFVSGACHAGQFETSIVMAHRPDLVADDLRTALDENNASLVAAIQKGMKTFKEAGGPDAYFGAPARASSDEGQTSIAIMGAALAETVSVALGRAQPA